MPGTTVLGTVDAALSNEIKILAQMELTFSGKRDTNDT